MQFNFSVIITCYNSQHYIKECLKSIISQNIGFKDNIEVILINDGSSDGTSEICQKFMKKYPQNIKYIENKSRLGPGISRNKGLKEVSGKYVNFLDSDDTISKNTFKNVLKFFKKHPEVDLVSIPIYYFENRKGSHYLNDKFKKTQVIDLRENHDYYQMSAPSSFVRQSAIKDIKFADIITSEDVVFVNEILINNPNIGLCCEAKYNYRKRYDNSSIINNSKLNKAYYTPRVKNYFKYLIDKSIEKYDYVLEFIQNVILYDISWMLKINVKNILDTVEIYELKKSLSNILQYIDDDMIYNYQFLKEQEKINTLFLKYGSFKENIFSKFKLENVTINIYDIIEDNLYILLSLYHFRDIDFDVYVNNKKIKIKEMFFPQKDKKFLDYTYLKNYTFECNIPLKDLPLKLEFKNDEDILNINFKRVCNFSKIASYHQTKKYLSTYNNTYITIENKTTFKWLKREAKTLINMSKTPKNSFKAGIPFRILYFLAYPFLKNKHIWFFMDRPEVADDNGIHLYNYAITKDKNIKKYFVINKNTSEYSEIKEYGDVLAFKSIKHRILTMFAENIVTTHPDSGIIYPFWGHYPYLAGLLKSNDVFLQHGIIKDDISSWLNKIDMNLAFFLTSAKPEYESVFNAPYNFDENVVKLLGLPRYDRLKNNENKRQIIIMPTWRRILSKKSNDYILNSQYFKIFNSLINNKKLIEYAKNNNYEIIFKPHPNVYKFIELFDKNDYVKIADKKMKYQTLFNNGSLLITDYSSIAFDFSYLKKPVIYYQYSHDYHFDLDNSYFDYETMGFGEVVKTEEDLINLIIKYLENNCQIKEKYLKRIDEFFLYTDKNNCKRVYEAIKEIPLKD